MIITHWWGFCTRSNNSGDKLSSSRRKWHRKCWVRALPANPHVLDLLIASLIPLMNSASQSLCPEWQHGTGHWVGSGDGEGVRCHLLCHCAFHFPLLELNRTEKATMRDPVRALQTTGKDLLCLFGISQESDKGVWTSEKTSSTNYSCHSHYTSFCGGSIWAVDIQWFVIIAETAGNFNFDSVCHVCCL